MSSLFATPAPNQSTSGLFGTASNNNQGKSLFGAPATAQQPQGKANHRSLHSRPLNNLKAVFSARRRNPPRPVVDFLARRPLNHNRPPALRCLVGHRNLNKPRRTASSAAHSPHRIRADLFSAHHNSHSSSSNSSRLEAGWHLAYSAQDSTRAQTSGHSARRRNAISLSRVCRPPG